MRIFRPAILAVVSALLLTGTSPSRGADPTYVFELSISGKTWQTGVILNPGVKPPIGKVTNDILAKVLKGELDDYASDFLDLDAGGRFFLYYDGKSTWRVATNSSGAMPITTLEGQVANDGQFWMAADYDLPMIGPELSCFATGKVKFQKGSFVPKSISGKLYLVGDEITTGANLKFKTKGPPTIVGP